MLCLRYIVAAILGVLLVIGPYVYPRHIFPRCSDRTDTIIFASAMTLLGIAIFILVFA